MLSHCKQRVLFILGVALVVSALVGLAFLYPAPVAAETAVSPLTAAPSTRQLSQTAVIPPTQPSPDLACRLCHSDTEAVVELPSGETLPVQVNLDHLAASAHGNQADEPLICTDCHQPVNNYKQPHVPVETADLRHYQIERAATCERCHQAPHRTSHPGPDAENPVICTDCHSSHDVLTATAWRSGEGTDTCVDCHMASNVDQTDPDRLTTLIQNGLFGEDRINSDYCLSCHTTPDFTLTFENGDVLSLTIDPTALHDSVHGVNNSWQPLACTDCHQNYTFPHDPPDATSLREYNLEKYTACARCHEQNYEKTLDSTHARALGEGNVEAAVCTDCHGNHDIPPPAEPRQRISQTCRQCHSTIFDEYAQSVHGDALLTESNPDVPTCIECHGVHDIRDPTTTLFRVRSPLLCATCHADAALMTKYDISTEVFDTYVADFHGTTVTLFEHQDPEVETNKAVCYDCHGVHNIKMPDDPEAGIKANLLETCQQCHPDASANFPDSWTSHFRPSLEHNPLVYIVNLFYQIVIPLTVGFLGFLVLTDIYRRVRLRMRTKSRPSGD